MESSRVNTRNYKKCVVCGRRRLPSSDVFLARIPVDPDRSRKWIRAIGQEDLAYIPIEKLHDLKFVCNAHFRNEDINKSRTRLLSHAVPCLNLPLQPLNDEVLHDFPLHINQYPGNDLSAVPGTSLSDNINVQSCKRKCVDKKDSSEDPSCEVPGPPLEVPGPSSDRPGPLEELPGPSASCKNVIVKGYKRKSNETKDSSEDPSSEVPGPSSDRPGPLEELPGPSASCKNVIVKGYKRKSNETKGLTAREERLLQKLKAQKLTIKKLAKTSLDLDKLDHTVLKNLVSDAAKNKSRKPTGKRWTMNTKLWALAVFKRSPKAYRYLQWALSAPSIKTLQRLLQSVPLEPGINKGLLLKSKEILSGLNNQNRYCALLFDEMSLKRRVIYNEHSDKIEGFEDYGDERSSKPADHVLVFMIQGLKKKIKLPVAYYFVQGTISSAKLMVNIKNVINEIEKAGFTVVTTVCDQGPTNVGALSLLKKFGGQSQEDNYFKFNNSQNFFIMFDIPHLFKSIRNNFYNAGEIVWGQKKGKWSHLIEAEDRNKNFLNFPKLDKNVVNPTFKIKMRVKYAARALSNTMSAILHMLAWKHETAAKEINETAEIVKELDKLFDICNGPSGPRDIKKGIRENVSNKTKHIEMWKYFGSKIEEIKFLKSDSQLQLKHVTCIKGFKLSLKSLHDIWQLLKNNGFKYLNLRQLNQDSLENLFGMIRQHSATNKNPTCSHFTAALKTLILSGLTAPHSRGSNCEPDSNNFLFDYKNIECSTRDEVEPTTSAAEGSENVPVLSLPDDEDYILQVEDLCSFEDQPVVYVSGYLASKLLRSSDCEECKSCLSNKNTNNDLYHYIRLREWWNDKKSLTYPSIALCKTVSQAKTIFENFENLHENNVSEICTLQFTVHCDLTWFTCTKHVELRHTLLRQLSILFIRKKCKIINETFSFAENETGDFYKKAQVQSKA